MRRTNRINYSLIFTFFAVVSLLLIFPHAYQLFFGFNLLLGEESYSKINDIQEIIDSDADYFLEPLDFILFKISSVVELEFFFKIIPFFSGLLSLAILYMIFKKLNFDDSTMFYSLLFVALSPLFLNHSFLFSLVSFVIPCVLLAFFLLLKKKYVFSSIFFMISTIFDPSLFIIMIVPLFFYLNEKKEDYRHFILLSCAGLIGSLVFLRFFVGSVMPSIPEGSLIDFLFLNINVFGAREGFSLILLILAFTFFFSDWKNRKKNSVVYILLSFLIVSSVIFDSSAKHILSIIASVFAGYGFVAIMNMKWELINIRSYVKYAVLFSVIMSAFMFIDTTIDSSPDIDLVEALKKIKEDIPFGDIVLTNPDYSEVVYYFSGHRAFFDDNSDPDLVRFVFKNHDDKTLDIFSKNKISFVIIDEDSDALMRTKKGIKGLEFLMEHNSCFMKSSQHNSVQVWQFTC